MTENNNANVTALAAKTCIKCGTAKPTGDFYHYKRKDKVYCQNICKRCEIARLQRGYAPKPRGRTLLSPEDRKKIKEHLENRTALGLNVKMIANQYPAISYICFLKWSKNPSLLA
jgi:hypothetical protein